MNELEDHVTQPEANNLIASPRRSNHVPDYGALNESLH